MAADPYPAMCDMNSEAMVRDHPLVDKQRVRTVILHSGLNHMGAPPTASTSAPSAGG